MCEATDDLAGALGAYRSAADLRPKDDKIQANIARLTKLTEQPKTIDDWKKLVAKEPNNKIARHRLGQLLAEQGDETSIAELTRATEIDPASPDIRNDLANAHLRFGKFRAAASAFRAAAERYPEESPKQIATQNAARSAMRWAGLESRLPEILAGSVTALSTTGWVDFGEVCKRTGRFAAAAKFFGQAAIEDNQYLRPAAVYAALAGFNRGKDADELSESQRAELRRRAMAILSKNRAWASDPELSPLKDTKSLEKLDSAERDAWRTLFNGEVAGR
jgi:tetratricopeptide (TPR) repeat protein